MATEAGVLTKIAPESLEADLQTEEGRRLRERDIARLLSDDPPIAILTGKEEPPLDRPLERFAMERGYRKVLDRFDGATLWVRTR